MLATVEQIIAQDSSSYISELLTPENRESTLQLIKGNDKELLYNYAVLGRALSKILTTQYSTFTCKLVHVTLESTQLVTYAELKKLSSINENQFIYTVNNKTVFGFSMNSGRNLLNQNITDNYITSLDQYYLYESYGIFLIQQFFNLHFWTNFPTLINDIQDTKNISKIKMNSDKKYVLIKFKMKINDYNESDIWILNNI